MRGVFAVSEICNPFSICTNNLVMGLEGSYGVTMALMESSVYLGVMVLYYLYRLLRSSSVMVSVKPKFALATPST